MKIPTVGVALLNWNGGEFTVPCIESLLSGTFIPHEIVVVDNGSIDESPNLISSNFPDVVLIRNKVNRGFAGANNQAINYLVSRKLEYIWVLNNDTIISTSCLEVLLRHAMDHKAGAGFSGKIFHAYPSDCLWYAGSYRHWLHLAPTHCCISEIESHSSNGAVSVPFISGCCMLVPRWAWEKYGGFIDDYIAYCEDDEWCWRVTKDTGSLYYIPGATLWHRLSASVRKNMASNSSIPPKALYLMYRNHFWTLRLHAEGLSRTVALAASLAIVAKNILYYRYLKNCASAYALIKGMNEGLFNLPLQKKYHFS